MAKELLEKKSKVPVEEHTTKKHFQSSDKYSKEERMENLIALGLLVLLILTIVGLSTHWFGFSTGTTLDEQFPPTQILLRSEASMGSKSAPIIIIELSDFECPFCGEFERTVFPQIKKEYIDSGEVLWFFMEFPLTKIHPHSYKAAIAAECAKLQNKFWEYHDVLFAHQENLTVPDLKSYAANLGLDMPVFSRCLDGNETGFLIMEAFKQAHDAGISATPSFIVGKPGIGDTVSGFKVVGVESLETFQKLIDATKHKRLGE